MTTLQFTAGQLSAQCSQIPLGIRAENDVTRVELDFSAWAEEFGAGVVQLLIKRSGDASPYPVLLSQSGSTAVWTVSATDLAVRGPLEAEYLYTVGTTVKKSEVLRFYVLRDIGAPGSAPDPYTEWLAQLTGLAADTEAASQAIQDMDVEATTLPPGSAATVTKTVDPDTGAVTLSFGIPESDLYPQDTAAGTVARITDGAENVPVEDLTVAIVPVQSGSGTPAPDNVRPISGWTGVTVTRCGKNLLPTQTVVNIGNQHYVGGQNVYFFFKAGTYSVSNSGTAAYMYRREKGGTANNIIHTTAANSGSFTLTEDSEIRFWFYTTAADASFSDIQIEAGSAVTAYEPYSGNSCSVSWQSDAGTVYGGELDLTGGELTVTHGYIASYAGETLPGEWISDRDVYAPETSPSTGAQVVYEMASPVTYQIAPIEIRTVRGENNVWADTGDTIVRYRADPTLFIEKKVDNAMQTIAPIEDGGTASQAYAQGKYFYRSGYFCKAKTSIASGAAFALNTNYEITTVAAELFSALNLE